MQLKLVRSQRDTGVMTTNVLFCLDARVHFTQAEANSINRYKLAREVIYNSQASQRYLDRADAQRDGSIRGSMASIASVGFAAMHLNISIGSLARGHHIECKTLAELLDAEEAVVSACRKLNGYLETAATFDGKATLLTFEDGEIHVVTQDDVPTLAAPEAQIQLAAPVPIDPKYKVKNAEDPIIDYVKKHPMVTYMVCAAIGLTLLIWFMVYQWQHPG